MAATADMQGPGRAGAEEHRRRSIYPAAKVRNSPATRISPYMKRNITQRHPNPVPGPVSTASKSKTPYKSPYSAASCARARVPGPGRLAAPKSPPKSKRPNGGSPGATREKSCVAVTHPEAPLVQVQVKRTKVKLLDAERVKSLRAAAQSPGGQRQNVIPHQPHLRQKQEEIPESPGGEGMCDRGEDNHRCNSSRLSLKIAALALGDQDGAKSTEKEVFQESDPPDCSQQQGSLGNANQSEETAHTQTSPRSQAWQSTSGKGDATTSGMDPPYAQNDTIQEQLPGEDTGALTAGSDSTTPRSTNNTAIMGGISQMILADGSKPETDAMVNHEEPNAPWLTGSNNIIRQSQGVLVLTHSTDDNAVFIPKLHFQFTPDNSIDWTALYPPATHCTTGGRRNDHSIANPCTPHGPSFSKSFLKKSCTLPEHRLSGKESNTHLSSGEHCNSIAPPCGIVDLSISFQGKFEEQEIPTDIPKILLTEEDNEDD